MRTDHNSRHVTGRTLVRAEIAECIETLVGLVLEHGGNTERTMLDVFEFTKQRFDSADQEIRDISLSIQTRVAILTARQQE